LIRLSLLPAARARTFQRSRLRSSRPCYGAFNLATGRSLGFGSHAIDSLAILRLAFAAAPGLTSLSLADNVNSPVHYAKGTPSPVADRSAIGLRPLVSAWFQVLFTRLVAVLFIVQSPYWFTIGHRGVFSLARWAGRFRTGFHEPRATLVRPSTPISSFAYGTLTRSGAPSQTLRLDYFSSGRPQPHPEGWFGLFRVRSPLLTESMSFSFPPGTEMFQFPGFALRRLYIQRRVTGSNPSPVSRFGDPRIDARLPASRGLSWATTSFFASRCQDIHHAPLVA
jgi:hypothetical protein